MRLAALLLAASTATGPVAGPQIEIVDCPTVDRARLESQLALELPRDGSGADAKELVLRLRCDGSRAVAEIEGPDGVRAQRELPALSPAGGDERTLALVFGELWEFHRAPAEVSPPVEPTPEPPRTAERVAEPSEHRPRTTLLWATVSAGATARSLVDTPLAAAGISAGAVGRLTPRLALGAAVRADAGRLRAELGLVHLWSVGLTASPRVRPLLRSRWGIDVALPLTVGYGQLRGAARADGARAATTGGLFADVGASVVPWVAVASHEIGLALAGGYRVRQPEGLVGTTARVSLGGPWVGGALELRFAAVTREQSR